MIREFIHESPSQLSYHGINAIRIDAAKGCAASASRDNYSLLSSLLSTLSSNVDMTDTTILLENSQRLSS